MISSQSLFGEGSAYGHPGLAPMRPIIVGHMGGEQSHESRIVELGVRAPWTPGHYPGGGATFGRGGGLRARCSSRNAR